MCKLIKDNCRGQHGPAKEMCAQQLLLPPPAWLYRIKINLYHCFLVVLHFTELLLLFLEFTPTILKTTVQVAHLIAKSSIRSGILVKKHLLSDNGAE